MNALVAGTVVLFLAALGVVCRHDTIDVPSLLVIVIAGDFVGGTIFSLQSDGVYDLHIRSSRTAAKTAEIALGGIWAYGLVGVPAEAVGLLITARIVGVDDATVANALTADVGVLGAMPRESACLGVFAVTVVGGLLGLNLIRVISGRLKAEIQRETKGQVAPIRLLDRENLLMDVARQNSSLLLLVWQARALKRL